MITSASSDTRFAQALASHIIALTTFRSDSTVTRFTTVARIIIIIIIRATVALFSDHILATEALARVTVAMFHSTFFA